MSILSIVFLLLYAGSLHILLKYLCQRATFIVYIPVYCMVLHSCVHHVKEKNKFIIIKKYKLFFFYIIIFYFLICRMHFYTFTHIMQNTWHKGTVLSQMRSSCPIASRNKTCRACRRSPPQTDRNILALCADRNKSDLILRSKFQSQAATFLIHHVMASRVFAQQTCASLVVTAQCQRKHASPSKTHVTVHIQTSTVALLVAWQKVRVIFYRCA